MRRTLADLQRPDDEGPRTGQGALALEGARRVTTPEFAGTTFLEVEAKSALNAVRGMPFAWSINPYRGCSHACSYCLDGDTPILMGDGATLPLRDVRVGDTVFGTRRDGRYRRFVRTQVRDHWSVTRPAWRIRLADGTDLVASGEHRLLTHRGWRHVTSGEHEQDRAAAAPQVPGAHPGGRRPRLLVYDWLAGPRGRVREGDALELATRVVAVEPLGGPRQLFDITTASGDFVAHGVISHNCFARPTHRYLNLSPLADFERSIVVKTNVVEVLRAELAKPGWRGEPVALGTNTDPYQRCEGRYRLLPGIIRALAEARTPLSVLTKGTLVTRDRELLAAAAEQVDVTAALTVGMLDEACWRSSEPGTPHPRARIAAVRALNEAGVPTGVMLAPLMPDLNDDPEQIAALIDACAAAGATHITPIVLHLRPGVREVFMAWLHAEHPRLVDRYERLYRRATVATDYHEQLMAFVRSRRAEAWRRHGLPDPRQARAARADRHGGEGGHNGGGPRHRAERVGHAAAAADRAGDTERTLRAHAAQQLKLL